MEPPRLRTLSCFQLIHHTMCMGTDKMITSIMVVGAQMICITSPSLGRMWGDLDVMVWYFAYLFGTGDGSKFWPRRLKRIVANTLLGMISLETKEKGQIGLFWMSKRCFSFYRSSRKLSTKICYWVMGKSITKMWQRRQYTSSGRNCRGRRFSHTWATKVMIMFLEYTPVGEMRWLKFFKSSCSTKIAGFERRRRESRELWLNMGMVWNCLKFYNFTQR